MIGVAKTDNHALWPTVIAIGYRATSDFRGLRMRSRFTFAVRAAHQSMLAAATRLQPMIDIAS
jgi:hypothetical protein